MSTLQFCYALLGVAAMKFYCLLAVGMLAVLIFELFVLIPAEAKKKADFDFGTPAQALKCDDPRVLGALAQSDVKNLFCVDASGVLYQWTRVW